MYKSAADYNVAEATGTHDFADDTVCVRLKKSRRIRVSKAYNCNSMPVNMSEGDKESCKNDRGEGGNGWHPKQLLALLAL